MRKEALRHLLFSIVTFLCVLAFSESLSHSYFRYFSEKFQFANPEQYTVAPDRGVRLSRIFDPRLGWKVPERLSPATFPANVLATFGDSHTMCSDVGDDETWQHYLGLQMGKGVLNFGVGGYGTDQAFLRFRQEFPQRKTPLVSLGLILENINRVANVYRKFYYPKTGIPLTKPVFRLRGGNLELIPNPIQSVSKLHRLSDPAFVHELGKNDFWYQGRRLPYLGFPYLSVLFDGDFWSQVVAMGKGNVPSETQAAGWVNLWEKEPFRQVMFQILESFAAEARAQGATPLVIINPTRHDVLKYLRGEKDRRLEALLKFLADSKIPAFDGISLFSEGLQEQNVDRYILGHATPQGNKRFADLLGQWLRDLERISPEKVRVSEWNPYR